MNHEIHELHEKRKQTGITRNPERGPMQPKSIYVECAIPKLILSCVSRISWFLHKSAFIRVYPRFISVFAFCVCVFPASVAAQAPAASAVAVPAVKQPLGAITAVAFSPDGKQGAVGTYGQVVLY